MVTKLRNLNSVAALLFAFVLGGCSERQPVTVGMEDKQVATGPATDDVNSSLEGKVTCDGQPLDSGFVRIWQGGAAGAGQIQSDGAYRVDRLPEGNVQITVASHLIAAKSPEARKLRKAARDGGPDLPPHLRPRPKPYTMDPETGVKSNESKDAKRPSKAATSGVWEVLRQKYGSPASSDLEFKLRSGTNTFNIELNTN